MVSRPHRSQVYCVTLRMQSNYLAEYQCEFWHGFRQDSGVPGQCSTLYWSECTCMYVGPELDGRLNNGQVVSTVGCCTIRMNRAPCHLALTPPEIVFLSSTLRHSLHFCLVDRTKCMGRLTMHRFKSCRQVSSSRYHCRTQGTQGGGGLWGCNPCSKAKI